MMTAFTVKCVGVTFGENYPDDLHALSDIYALPGSEKVAAVLLREPENPYDPNAIAVHVPALGNRIGHIPRDLAVRLAPEMDDGRHWLAQVEEILVTPGQEHQPGCLLRCTPVDSDE
ncbi:MAG TPA: HIRAN domain-containing protein [Gemmatimonadaceae bacterium]|nr:HIRAN domain-containing protein [Gemmatimonadaceae bacterium]